MLKLTPQSRASRRESHYYYFKSLGMTWPRNEPATFSTPRLRLNHYPTKAVLCSMKKPTFVILISLQSYQFARALYIKCTQLSSASEVKTSLIFIVNSADPDQTCPNVQGDMWDRVEQNYREL